MRQSTTDQALAVTSAPGLLFKPEFRWKTEVPTFHSAEKPQIHWFMNRMSHHISPRTSELQEFKTTESPFSHETRYSSMVGADGFPVLLLCQPVVSGNCMAWNRTPLSPSSHLCHCLLLYDPLSPIFSNKNISFAQGENLFCPFPIISCFLSKIRLATCTEHWTSFQYFPGGQIYIHHSAEMTRYHLDISYKTKDHVQRTTLSRCSIKQHIKRKLTFRSDSGRLQCTLFSYGIPE